MKKGLFITIEGAEGSGKSSVARLLHAYYTERGLDVVLTKEPGGVDIAEQIRGVILNKGNVKMDSYTELLLYIAARRQHLVEKVIPALEEGKVVICDRFIDSTYAYQGFGRGIDLRIIESLNAIATDSKHYPVDLTVLLDVIPEVGLARINKNGRETNRLDVESLAFHERVRKGYSDALSKHPKRIVGVDASGDLYSTFLKVKTIIDKHLRGMSSSEIATEAVKGLRACVSNVSKSKKKILVLVGPSGSGKTTVINKMNEKGFHELVSHTTRPMRAGDTVGKNYFFVSEEEFAQQDFVEIVTYSGYSYGLTRVEIEKKLEQNDVVVIAAAIDGALSIKEQYPAETILIFLETSLETCMRRMEERGDKPDSIAKRLKNIEDIKEFDNGKYCDIVLNVESMSPEQIVNEIESRTSNKEILVFIGTSGSGKTALVRGLNKDGIPVIVTHTTRKIRPNEFNGIDYHFVTIDEFMRIDKLESAEYAGNYYGISKREIDDKLSRHDVIAVITSIEGGHAIRKTYPQSANLIFISVNKDLAMKRMLARGDKKEIISQRMEHMEASNESDNWKLCDYVLDNNRPIDATLETLKTFIDLIKHKDVKKTNPSPCDMASLIQRQGAKGTPRSSSLKT